MNGAQSVTIVECAPRQLASVRRQASLATLTATATAAPLWERAYANGIRHGRPVIVLHEAAGNAFFEAAGVPVDIGIEVDAPITDPVLAAITSPGGRAAMARHVGSEASIAATHALIRNWCAAHGETITGTVVIVHYWDDEPSRRVTEINYLLA
jgi:DNA gyrase inhibitor GyrI